MWCSEGTQSVTPAPRGTGIVAFSPAAFVTVKTVSSALSLGMSTTGGNQRSVSLRTLSGSAALVIASRANVGSRDAREGVGERAEVVVRLRQVEAMVNSR